MTVCYDTVLYNICDIFAELNLFVSRAETLSTSTIILPSCISLCFWFPHSSIFMELKAPIKLVKGWKWSQLELLHSAIYPKDFVRLCLCNMIIQSICCPLVSPEGRLWSHIGIADMPNKRQSTLFSPAYHLWDVLMSCSQHKSLSGRNICCSNSPSGRKVAWFVSQLSGFKFLISPVIVFLILCFLTGCSSGLWLHCGQISHSS